MRVVGQNKGCDIRLTDLYMGQTYGGFLSGSSEKNYEAVNWEMINVGIPQRVEKIWGKNRKLHVFEIDHTKRLPGVEVIAWIHCSQGVGAGESSDLVLAWFQEGDEDPFAKAASNLKAINWEEKAQSYDPADF